MAEVEGQFAGVEVILQQPNTRAFEDGKALGTGSLSVEERWHLLCLHSVPKRYILTYTDTVICTGAVVTGLPDWFCTTPALPSML